MVDVRKTFKKSGKTKIGTKIVESNSLFKNYARKARKAKKAGKNVKALENAVEIAEDSNKKIKSKSKYFKTKVAVIAAITAGGIYAGVNVGEGITEFNKRNNKKFTVTEVFYKEGDAVDEISFVITNPEKIEIYPDDSFIIVDNSPFYDSKIKISNRTIILNDQPYLITETKISKDKENDEQPNLNPDVPYVITIKINGLDLSGKDKDMIRTATSDEKLFVLQLKADFNNDIKDEFEDDGEAIKDALEKAVAAVADTGDDFLKWILDKIKTLLAPIGYAIGYGLLAILIIYILFLIGKTVILNYFTKNKK